MTVDVANDSTAVVPTMPWPKGGVEYASGGTVTVAVPERVCAAWARGQIPNACPWMVNAPDSGAFCPVSCTLVVASHDAG